MKLSNSPKTRSGALKESNLQQQQQQHQLHHQSGRKLKVKSEQCRTPTYISSLFESKQKGKFSFSQSILQIQQLRLQSIQLKYEKLFRNHKAYVATENDELSKTMADIKSFESTPVVKVKKTVNDQLPVSLREKVKQTKCQTGLSFKCQQQVENPATTQLRIDLDFDSSICDQPDVNSPSKVQGDNTPSSHQSGSNQVHIQPRRSWFFKENKTKDMDCQTDISYIEDKAHLYFQAILRVKLYSDYLMQEGQELITEVSLKYQLKPNGVLDDQNLFYSKVVANMNQQYLQSETLFDRNQEFEIPIYIETEIGQLKKCIYEKQVENFWICVQVGVRDPESNHHHPIQSKVSFYSSNNNNNTNPQQQPNIKSLARVNFPVFKQFPTKNVVYLPYGTILSSYFNPKTQKLIIQDPQEKSLYDRKLVKACRVELQLQPVQKEDPELSRLMKNSQKLFLQLPESRRCTTRQNSLPQLSGPDSNNLLQVSKNANLQDAISSTDHTQSRNSQNYDLLTTSHPSFARITTPNSMKTSLFTPASMLPSINLRTPQIHSEKLISSKPIETLDEMIMRKIENRKNGHAQLLSAKKNKQQLSTNNNIFKNGSKSNNSFMFSSASYEKEQLKQMLPMQARRMYDSDNRYYDDASMRASKNSGKNILNQKVKSRNNNIPVIV